MRIVKEDQNLMILKDRNIIVYTVGIIFLLVGIVVILKPDFFTNQPPLWSGFVGILIGFFIVSVAKSTTVKLDKSTNKFSLLQKWLIGQSNQDYDLNQIKEVQLSVAYSNSSQGSGCSYHLAFVFNNSSEIVPLNQGSSSIIRVIERQIIPEKNLGARIATFLGVPFQERRPPTVNESLSAVSSAIHSAAEKEIEKQKVI